jgi:NAD(P)H-dependent FMN reductase
MSTPDKEDRPISGSVRAGSYTRIAVRLALKRAEEIKCETQLIDLRDYQLLFCDGKDDESQYPKDVFRLREEVKQAQGIILGTPEYDVGYSGVLKNTLDLIGFEEFEGKMLGLVDGRFWCDEQSARSRPRALHAWVVPEHGSIPAAWQEFDDAGNLKNPKLEERVRNVGRHVARFAYMRGSCEANEFLQKWEKARVNPGGEDR